MTELLLVRHGRPESGQLDPPLNDEGLAQARALAKVLADEPITAIVSSDLRRAQQTAEIIGAATGQTPTSHEGLRELGLPADSMEYVALELLGADAPQVVAIDEGRFMDFVPERVDIEDFRRKVADAFSTIIAEHAGGRVVVVCHGGTINAYVGQLVGIPDIFWFHPDYSSVSRVDSRPGGRVVVRSLNEAHHLLVQSV
jgi:probable phosphoglycerate mutase